MGMAEILDRVAEETKIYLEAGVSPRPSKFKSLVDNPLKVDGLVLENMHDTPYCLEQQLGPHIGASMAVVARQVKHFKVIRLGQQRDAH